MRSPDNAAAFSDLRETQHHQSTTKAYSASLKLYLDCDLYLPLNDACFAKDDNLLTVTWKFVFIFVTTNAWSRSTQRTCWLSEGLFMLTAIQVNT